LQNQILAAGSRRLQAMIDEGGGSFTPEIDSELRGPYMLALRRMLQPDRAAARELHREFLRLSTSKKRP
jgi:hypothetical protein